MKHFAAIFLLVWIFVFCRAIHSEKSKSSKSARKKRDSKWTGSKLGTTDYNRELAVIEQAKVDYALSRENNSYYQRKVLLCAVFSRTATAALSNTIKNIVHMGNSCDWAIVFYDGDRDNIVKFCTTDAIVEKVIHCQRARESFKNKNSTDISRRGIPKSVLYVELLPYLRNYQRIFLMDEDISLLDFETESFLKIWDCAFRNQPPPLVVQPVIAESTQYFNFVAQSTWKETGIVATASGLVEQQVPFFDSIYFEWFVRRVLNDTRAIAIKVRESIFLICP